MRNFFEDTEFSLSHGGCRPLGGKWCTEPEEKSPHVRNKRVRDREGYIKDRQPYIGTCSGYIMSKDSCEDLNGECMCNECINNIIGGYGI